MNAFRPTLPRLAVCLVLLGLPVALLYRALFCGDAFVPADLLAYVAPWSHTTTPTAAWNVLRYDGITQFYPWRLLAARVFQSGHIPLWNPYAFAAAGGAPLLADSQSAPLYPPNLLFFDLLPPGFVWYGFGLSAFTHLAIAGTGLYRFLRALELRRAAALTGAVAFALSGPVVTWLALPTFLAVACWIPWLLLAIRAASRSADSRRRLSAGVGAALCIGLMLLAGHLQIALYGLLLAALYALTLGVGSIRAGAAPVRAMLAASAGILLTGVLLASPQLLPSVELSQVSHRAGNAQPYSAYISTALPIRNLVTLLEPDFFGHPNPLGALYWNAPRSNYAEWSLYVGVAPLFLAGFALGLPWRKRAEDAPTSALLPLERLFFACAALLSLLIALGTPLAAVLFYGVPGFRATGSPARILIVFALSVAVLAAIGLENLLRTGIAHAVKERAALIGLFAPILLAAIGASQAAQFQATMLPGTTLASLLAPNQTSLLVGLALTVAAVVAILLAARVSRASLAFGVFFVALTAGDLFVRGFGYNPSSPHEAVYPVTPGIAYLQQHARADDLIAPINRSWSMVKEDPPHHAVLPPNALSVYGLHDISGYDSLFPGVDKRQLGEAGGGEDPSPAENGNMLFVKRPETALALGARYLVFVPEANVSGGTLPGLTTAYSGNDLTILENPSPHPFDASAERDYRPTSFRVGLFGAFTAVAAISAYGGAAFLPTIRRRRVPPNPL